MRLILGDFLELSKDIQDESVDLVVTDPPYELTKGGSKTGQMGGIFAVGEYDNKGKLFLVPKFEDWIPIIWRILKPGTHFYCMSNDRNMFEIKKIAERCGFKYHRILPWLKNTATPNRWYMGNVEYTLLFRKGKQRYINDFIRN